VTSFLLLHRHPALAVSADSAWVPAEQAEPLREALALAQQTGALLDAQAARVQQAEQAGRAAGHAEGLALGLRSAQQAGAEQLAQTLGLLNEQAQAQHAALREAVVSLSLLVVRRMAAQLAPQTVLAALAQQALDQLAGEAAAEHGGAPGKPLTVVRLHPSLLDAVRAKVSDPLPGASTGMTVQWRADDTLAPMDCVIDTPNGRLLAGLEAQLQRVQAVLSQAQRSPAALQGDELTPA
jgi:type III secretion protein L